MLVLPYIPLPDHFAQLLSEDLTSMNYIDFEKKIIQASELLFLIKSLCRDIDSDGDLVKIHQKLGWTSLRNRLAAAYMEHYLTGSFPQVANMALVADLISLENKLRHFTDVNFSRAFLLAFYARMSLIHLRKNFSNEEVTPLLINDNLINYMKWSKSKSIRIDWLLLNLQLFEHYLGQSTFSSLIQSGSTFQSIFVLLSAEEQRQMMQNLLTYASSIGDTEILLSKNNVEH